MQQIQMFMSWLFTSSHDWEKHIVFVFVFVVVFVVVIVIVIINQHITIITIITMITMITIIIIIIIVIITCHGYVIVCSQRTWGWSLERYLERYNICSHISPSQRSRRVTHSLPSGSPLAAAFRRSNRPSTWNLRTLSPRGFQTGELLF